MLIDYFLLGWLVKWCARDALIAFFPQAGVACGEPRSVAKRGYEVFGVSSLLPGTVFDAS